MFGIGNNEKYFSLLAEDGQKEYDFILDTDAAFYGEGFPARNAADAVETLVSIFTEAINTKLGLNLEGFSLPCSIVEDEIHFEDYRMKVFINDEKLNADELKEFFALFMSEYEAAAELAEPKPATEEQKAVVAEAVKALVAEEAEIIDTIENLKGLEEFEALVNELHSRLEEIAKEEEELRVSVMSSDEIADYYENKEMNENDTRGLVF